MNLDTLPTLGAAFARSDVVRARWARLAEDFLLLPRLDQAHALASAGGDDASALRDVGELLLRGHDEALAEAERYITFGHTVRTGHVVECDDIDDAVCVARWVRELDRASSEGHAPPVPRGFWASFLRWRTPLGMARFSDRRVRTSRVI